MSPVHGLHQRAPPLLRLAMLLQYAVGGSFLPFVILFFQGLGIEYSQLIWIFIGSSALGSTMPLVWGYVADRLVSLERLIAALHFCGVVALLLLAGQNTFHGSLIFFDAVVAVLLPTNALLNALAYRNLECPERDFGRLRVWGSIGWLLPSLPIFLWLSIVDTIDLTFTLYLAAAVELVMGFLALRLPHTPPVATGTAGSRSHGLSYWDALKHLLHHKGFSRFLLIVFLMQGAFAIFFYYSPPMLEAAGFERRWIGPLQGVGIMVEIPMFFLLAGSIRRLGYGATLCIGCAALLVRHLLFCATSAHWILTASYALVGLSVVFYLITGSLAVNAMAGREVTATAQTIFSIVGQGLGQMGGHVVAGTLAQRPELGLHAVFVYASATTAAALLLAATLSRRGTFRLREAPPEDADGREPLIPGPC